MVEPEKDLYLPFIKPMLDASESKYHLADLEGWKENDMWSSSPYLDAGLLPDQNLDKIHGSTPRRNNSLLILANLGAVSRKTGKYPYYSSYKRIMEFMRMVQTTSGIHSNGQVRMLMWIPDLAKASILPRSIWYRRRLTALAELMFHVEEVAGSTAPSRLRRREHKLDLESSLQTLKRMEEQNITVPVHRLGAVTLEAQAMMNSENLEKELPRIMASHDDDVHRDWHQELCKLEQAFADGKLSMFSTEEKKARGHRREYTAEYVRFKNLQRARNQQRKNKLGLDDLVDEEEAIAAMDLKISEASLEAAQRQEMLAELDRRTLQNKHLREKPSSARLGSVDFITDDRKAYRRHEPLLMWDKRTCDPIKVEKDEVHPGTILALLDFQAKDSRAASMTYTQWQYLEWLTDIFFGSASLSIVDGLDLIAPGAADAIIQRVPSLRDPRKGGRRDLDQLRARLLTSEMLHDIGVAFEKWPFRPTLAELQMHVKRTVI